MNTIEGRLEETKILGRNAGDHERLFPKFTTAEPSCTGEVEVNGKKLIIWEFSQLEALKPAVLRHRAMAIRDAVGEVNCPPMPSMQTSDLTRWIIHMQNELTQKDMQVTRSGFSRSGIPGAGVPPTFKQEHEGRPILPERVASPRSKPAPFGPRKIDDDHGMEATRDHYNDLLEQKKEFTNAHVQGLSTLRVGGEGRKKINHRSNMECSGVSNANPKGIQSMKDTGEGRRYIRPTDNVGDQKREAEDIERGRASQVQFSQGIQSGRMGGEGRRQITATDHLFSDSGGYPDRSTVPTSLDPEPHIGGERKRHMNPGDHMLNHGTAADIENPHGIGGRRHLSSYGGMPSNGSVGGVHDQYRTSWKKDNSRLKGASMIV